VPARTPRTLRPSSAEGDRALVQRAIAFERECLAIAAGQRREHPLGLWTRNLAHPQMWTMNQLHVIGRHPTLTAPALMAELDAELADARHRRAVLDDDATGRRLAEDFRSAGWLVSPLLVMLLDREPPEPPPGVACEVGEDAMLALDEQIVADDPELPELDRPVVLAGHVHMRKAVPRTRLFVGARDGTPASQATLFTDGRTGQPETVGTLSRHEGHGLASAVVSLAAREALAAGCDLVFILCRADTGPVPLYAGLGFRAAGRYWAFTRPA
jgi:GNAT superfamily N-acetyltransferase